VTMCEIELTTEEATATGCTGRCISNYHAIKMVSIVPSLVQYIIQIVFNIFSLFDK